MWWTGPDTWRSPSTITAMLPCTTNPSDRPLMFTHRGSTGWDERIEEQARPVARIATDRGRERAHLRDELSRRDAVLDEGLRRHRAVAHLRPSVSHRRREFVVAPHWLECDSSECA